MFTCPICKESLQLNGKSLVCNNNHCFDYAKQGYVNLLPVQQKKSLHPGDTREMLLARKNFLSNGHYEKILDKVASLSIAVLLIATWIVVVEKVTILVVLRKEQTLLMLSAQILLKMQ